MASAEVPIVRVREGIRLAAADRVAVEEPLEVRLHGRTFAVIMRTPGADRELAAGFLLAERIVASADGLGTIEHCRDGAVAGSEAGGEAVAENVVNVMLVGTNEAAIDRLLADRRHVTTNASCGVCGRLSIESLRDALTPLPAGFTVPAATIVSLPDRLRTAQAMFDETGGLHAAACFDRDGVLLTSAEDVGRHNAVDKVVGRMLLRDALPLSGAVLAVSGRTSFEIVQKAWCAGAPVVASVSAPSSLAIELAHEAGIALVGFVRGAGFNIYAHGGRIA
jgi:FdhD protein